MRYLWLMLLSSGLYGQSVKELQEQINSLAEEIKTLKINKAGPQDQFFGLG